MLLGDISTVLCITVCRNFLYFLNLCSLLENFGLWGTILCWSCTFPVQLFFNDPASIFPLLTASGTTLDREYWMIYGGPRFLAVVWFGSSRPLHPLRELSFFLSLPVCRRSSLLTEERGVGGGRGAKSYDREKT
jgi:hypothetical protein